MADFDPVLLGGKAGLRLERPAEIGITDVQIPRDVFGRDGVVEIRAEKVQRFLDESLDPLRRRTGGGSWPG